MRPPADVASPGRPAAIEFTDWVRPHLVAMAALAARLSPTDTRDDVVQEALTAAWRKYGQYDPARGTPRSWLMAIVADQAHKQTRKWRPIASLNQALPVTDRPGDVDLERAVTRLPRRQRLAVALYYFIDLPVAEVAATMGCSEGTVKATLSHARDALRAHLGQDD